MVNELTHPHYIYADILIALAHADGEVHKHERELLDGIFARMRLDRDTLAEMWLTPRTLDVIASLLNDLPDPHFRNCLLKDCFLVAYADRKLDPREHHFIRHLTEILHMNPATVEAIRQWVETALEQKRKADELFGAEGEAIHA